MTENPADGDRASLRPRARPDDRDRDRHRREDQGLDRRQRHAEQQEPDVDLRAEDEPPEQAELARAMGAHTLEVLGYVADMRDLYAACDVLVLPSRSPSRLPIRHTLSTTKIMPTVRFRDQDLPCDPGARLRDVLLAANDSPHNGRARLLNCRGFGTCGTCAVSVRGEVSAPTARERWRLSFPPHQPESGLRLACQVRVLGDLEVDKHPGFWGQYVAG